MTDNTKTTLADALKRIVVLTWNEWGAGFGHNGDPKEAQHSLFVRLAALFLSVGIDLPPREFAEPFDVDGYVPTVEEIQNADREVIEVWAKTHIEKLIASGEFKTIPELREEVAIGCGYHSWSQYMDYQATGPKVGRDDPKPLEEMNNEVAFKFGEQFANAMLASNRARTDAWFKNSQLQHQIELLREANRGLASVIQQNHEWHTQYDDHGTYEGSELHTANTSALNAMPPAFRYEPKTPITVPGFEKTPVVAQHWGEFRETGLLLIMNQLLHAFGWCIVLSIDGGKVVAAYPALTEFRGFGDESITEAYRKLSIYMDENSKYLREQAHK